MSLRPGFLGPPCIIYTLLVILSVYDSLLSLITSLVALSWIFSISFKSPACILYGHQNIFLNRLRLYYTGLAKKGATDSWPQFCQIITDLKIVFTGWFPCKFAVKWTFKIPTLFAYVATLRCETLVSEKQAINDKFQGSVATYLRCGEVSNNQIMNGLLKQWVIPRKRRGKLDCDPKMNQTERRLPVNEQPRSAVARSSEST